MNLNARLADKWAAIKEDTLIEMNPSEMETFVSLQVKKNISNFIQYQNNKRERGRG